jgi:hypothetical protein
MKTWWERASTEERLAQIDGGIACGMTSKQVAVNCGAPIYRDGNALICFANAHGRKFGQSGGTHKDRVISGKIGKMKLFRSLGYADTDNLDAFKIFENSSHSERFLDAHPGEA